MKRVIGVSLLMVLLMVSVVYAGQELVNNGTFDEGLDG